MMDSHEGMRKNPVSQSESGLFLFVAKFSLIK